MREDTFIQEMKRHSNKKIEEQSQDMYKYAGKFEQELLLLFTEYVVLYNL